MPLVIRRRRYGVRRPRRRVAAATVYRRYGARPAMRGALRSMITRPNTYDFKRKVFYENAITVSAAGANYANAWSFQFGLLPNVTDFTNLYDQYLIKKIVFKIIPKFTQALMNVGTVSDDLPQIHTAIDYDDSTNPASISAMCEYQSHKMTRGNKMHVRTLVPKVELDVASAAGASAPKAFQWLDCDVTNTDHRGIKVYIPKPITAGTQLMYDVQVSYYFSCKNVV